MKTPRRSIIPGGGEGYPLRSIFLHSLWITAAGLILFRLATANTQTIVYIHIFAISGAVLITAPWAIQLVVSTAIILMYNAGGRDLTWLVQKPAKKLPRLRRLRAVTGGDGYVKRSVVPVDGDGNYARLVRARTI